MVQCFTMSKIMVMNVRQLIESPPPPLPYSAMADRFDGNAFCCSIPLLCLVIADSQRSLNADQDKAT